MLVLGLRYLPTGGIAFSAHLDIAIPSPIVAKVPNFKVNCSQKKLISMSASEMEEIREERGCLLMFALLHT